jgi:hypothetical protein
VAVQLNVDKHVGKGLNFGPIIGFSSMSLLELTRHPMSSKQFLAPVSITEMECPLCSPDLALNDFWLFPEIKSALKG